MKDTAPKRCAAQCHRPNFMSRSSKAASCNRHPVTDRSLVEVLRVIWWRHIRDGHRIPAQPGVILNEVGGDGL